MRPTADELKRTLGLEPHPTCGFVRETYRSEEAVPEAALPGFTGERRRASVLYFLVAPDAYIALHRIKPTQMYHHYLGDPLEVLLLYEDGTGAIEKVGSLADGLSPQLLIPGQTWPVAANGAQLRHARNYRMAGGRAGRRRGRRRRATDRGLSRLCRCARAVRAEARGMAAARGYPCLTLLEIGKTRLQLVEYLSRRKASRELGGICV